MLSDEQMSKRWPFSLLNDEQMSNWVGVKHLPVLFSRLLGEDEPNLTSIFFKWVVQPPSSLSMFGELNSGSSKYFHF